MGKATLTGGATAYIYPNKAGLTKDFNTVEIYGKLAVDAPLSPKINVYYDVDKVKGLYVEGSVSHSVPGEREGLGKPWTALAGVNSGQGVNADPNSDETANFFPDSGFTHLDLSAGIPVTAGIFSITPAFHVVINGDDATKFTSLNKTHDVKFWGGATISWSKSYGDAAEEEPAASEIAVNEAERVLSRHVGCRERTPGGRSRDPHPVSAAPTTGAPSPSLGRPTPTR